MKQVCVTYNRTKLRLSKRLCKRGKCVHAVKQTQEYIQKQFGTKIYTSFALCQPQKSAPPLKQKKTFGGIETTTL